MRLRSLAHPSSVISVAVLVLGLSSTAFAAGAITGAQIKDGSVTSADVHNGTLRTKDLARATINRLHGSTGPQGPAGPTGSNGVSGWEIVAVTSDSIPANTHAELQAACPVGKKTLSASAFWEGSDDAVQVVLEQSGSGATAFSAGVSQDDILDLDIVCAAVS